MKKIYMLISLILTSLLITGCFDDSNSEPVVPDENLPVVPDTPEVEIEEGYNYAQDLADFIKLSFNPNNIIDSINSKIPKKLDDISGFDESQYSQYGNIEIIWKSSNTDYLTDGGIVFRPTHQEEDIEVTYTAYIYMGSIVGTKEFLLKLPKNDSVVTLTLNSPDGKVMDNEVLTLEEGQTLSDVLRNNEITYACNYSDLRRDVDWYCSQTKDLRFIHNIPTSVNESNLEMKVDGIVSSIEDTVLLKSQNIEVTYVNISDNYEDLKDEFYKINFQVVDGYSNTVYNKWLSMDSNEEILWDVMNSYNNELAIGCNYEGYIRDIDWDCGWYAPGLGYSIRAIAGVPSTWYGSFLSLKHNEVFSAWGVSSLKVYPGWSIKFTYTDLDDDNYADLVDEFYPSVNMDSPLRMVGIK